MSEPHDDSGDTVVAESSSRLTPAVLASVASVALALYYYYAQGDKQRGQFVGLWPTTILALAIYFKLDEIRKALAQAGD
ncbi:MAG: hypothetical protein J07HX64_00823 [halophilic archaeon J07HX64]|nr:MAG: hypothetical protein J07HX64_00823 [halophilic archaeon J07HX64]